MKPAEEPPRYGVAQEEAQAPVPEVSLSQPVAVGEEHGPAEKLDPDRLLMEFHSDAVAEEAAPPPVVVATHEQDRHTGLHEVGKRGQHPHMFGEHDPAVLEPEVEEVAVDDQAASRFLDVEQPAPECFFGVGRDRAKVYVGNEKGWL